jgi:WXG100 family type VII secretion target
MATYGLDPRNLIDTSGELIQATEAIKRALEALDTAVNSYHGDNTGETASAFHAAQSLWKSGFEEMNMNLGSAAVALDLIRETFVLTDRQGAASF